MPTGYGEFAKTARQGALSPQQWNAYLMQRNQIRTAYKQAFNQLQSAAQQEGLNIAPPELGNNVSQAEAQAKLKAYADQVNQNLSYFDVDVQLNAAYKNAVASGLNVPRPTQYGKTVKDAATAKVIFDNYTNKISQIALQKGLINAISDIRAQAAKQGVTLQGLSPDAYTGLTEARAQYFVDSYLKNANNQIAVKNYNDAINSISAQARAQGVSVAAPTASAINSANVQNMIDQYAASVNNALLQKSVSGAVDSICVQAKAQGVEVAKPSVNGVSQANAQAVVDSYLTKVNKALESKAASTSAAVAKTTATIDTAALQKNVNTALDSIASQAAVYGVSVAKPSLTGLTVANAQITVDSYLAKVNNALAQVPPPAITNVDPQKSSGYSFKYTMSHAQQNKYLRENETYKQQGKPQLTEYEFRKANGITTETLSEGRYTAPKITRNKYSAAGTGSSMKVTKDTGNSGTKHAPVGSGDIKLQQIKVNTSGITGAVKKVGTAEYNAKLRPGQIQLKDGSWVNQVQKVGGNAGKGEIRVNVTTPTALADARNDAIKARKEAEAIRNAYVPVKDKSGRIIDAIQVKSAANTGEGAVSVQKRQILRDKKGDITGIKILASSGSAREIKNELNAAKRIAKVAITDRTSALDQKAILSAREKIASRMYTGEKIRYLSDLRNADTTANRRLKTFTAAQSKYYTVDQKAFDRELKNIEKETKGMSEAQKKKYLLERAKTDIPTTGRASDLWTKLNSDIFTGEIDKGLITGGSVKYAKSGSADVMDNISRKQMSGEPLTATEVSLLTAVNNGYKPSTTVKEFVNVIGKVTGKTQKYLEKNLETRTAKDYSGLRNEKVSTKLAGYVNSVRNAAIAVPGMVGGFAGGVAQAAEYTGREAKTAIKSGSVTGVKQAAFNVGLSATLVASNMGRGSVKQYKEDPVEFVATLALTQAVLGGAGKGISKTNKYVKTQTGIKRGTIRKQTLGSEIIPYKEVGSTLDKMRAGEQIEGMHATVFRTKKGKKVFTNEPGHNPSYAEPGTFGHKGRFSTVSDGIVEPFGEFFLTKRKSITPEFISDRLKPISKVTNPITGKVSKVLKAELAKQSSKPVTLTDKAISWSGKQLKQNYEKNYTKFMTRSARKGEKIVYKVSGDPVKLTEAQWEKVFTKFKREGNFWTEYEKIQKIAQKQADKSGKPIATPSPKTALGDIEAESEVWWVFPKKGSKITSSQKIGKTEKGVDIVEVRYGNQAPIVRKSVSQRMKENREYNKQVFKALDGKKYNLNHLKSYASDANRRLGELYGGKTTRPRAFEGGRHGKLHTEQVGKNVASQTAKGAEGMEYWLGVMHDVTKIGEYETAGIPHAVAAAEVIKRGMITDARFNTFWNSLSKRNQSAFVKAIGEHTTIKPLNKHLITEVSLKDLRHPIKDLKDRVETLKEGVKTKVRDRPSEMSKALANADRMDLTRFGIKPQKRKMFDLKANKPSGKAVKSPSKVKTAEERIKLIEQKIKPNKSVKEPVKQPQKKQYYIKETTGIKLKPYIYAASASQRGAGVTYAEYTKGVENTYSVLKAYQKDKSRSYENLKPSYKKQPSGQNYRGTEAEYRQRKGTDYKKPEGYEYKQKAGNYKTVTGYEAKPYSGNYKVKSDYSAYTAKGKYKASGYGGSYGGSGGSYGGSYPGSGSGYGGGYVKPPNQKTVISIKGRQADSRKAIRSVKDLARFTRKIQNQFGNLDTMFGKSTAKPVKKTMKKSVKRVQRA